MLLLLLLRMHFLKIMRFLLLFIYALNFHQLEVFCPVQVRDGWGDLGSDFRGWIKLAPATSKTEIDKA